MPRTTSNWLSPMSSGRRYGDRADTFTEVMIDSLQRVRLALDAVGPEMAGLLLDVCCFLERLEDVELERLWPAPSAKVALQLALDGLARHYGYAEQATGCKYTSLRSWLADDRRFGIDGA
jgi:hypothetical protein